MEDEEEPVAAGRQPRRLGDDDPPDLVEVELAAQLVRQLIDEVQLAVAVERLAGEAPLVRLAGDGVGQDRRDRAPGSIALDPAHGPALDRDRELLEPDPGRLALEDHGPGVVPDPDPGVRARQKRREHRRDVTVADDQAGEIELHQAAPPSPSAARAMSSSSSGSNGFVR